MKHQVDELEEVDEAEPARPRRARRLPARYQDDVPQTVSHVALAAPTLPKASETNNAEEDTTIITKPDALGMFRTYPHAPTVDPDQAFSLKAISDTPNASSPLPSQSLNIMSGPLRQVLPSNIFHPLPDITSFRMLEWFYGSTGKSQADMDRLVHDVILADDFNRDDLRDFNTKRALHILDTESVLLAAEDGWTKSSVSIAVPIRGRGVVEDDAPRFEVPGLHYRSLIAVIKSAFASAPTGSMHLTPFKQHWQHNGEDQRVWSELYNSDAFYDEHVRIRRETREATELEIVVAALMFWSDSTHLANFGTAALWPVYLYFGNISKYIRGRPTSFSAHHVAYLPTVSCIACFLIIS
jgi:hypothetical protein